MADGNEVKMRTLARRLLLAVALVFGSSFILHSWVMASSLGALDESFRSAAVSTNLADFVRHSNDVESRLRAIASDRPSAPTVTDIDIGSRVALLDGMRAARGHIEANELLQALRRLVECSDVVASLRMAASNKLAEPSSKLKAIADAFLIWARRIGNGAKIAGLKVSDGAQGRVVHRAFFLSSGRLSAFELIEDETAATLRWVEPLLGPINGQLIASIGPIVRKFSDDGAHLNWKFILLAIGDTAQGALALEARLSRDALALAQSGVLPIIVAPRRGGFPYLKIPSIRSDEIGFSGTRPRLRLIRIEGYQQLLEFTFDGAKENSIFRSLGLMRSFVQELTAAYPKEMQGLGSAGALPPKLKPVESRPALITQMAIGAILDQDYRRIEVEPLTTMTLDAVSDAGWSRYRLEATGALIWVDHEDEKLLQRSQEGGRRTAPVSKGTR